MQQRAQRAEASQSRAQLDMLTAQRGELQEQARQLSERRNVLFAQARNASGAARGELESRMSEIDARLSRLDDQIAKMNEQIVSAMGRVGAAPAPVVVDVPRTVNIPRISIPPFESSRQRGPDMREVGGIMAAEAVALALIGVAFWRFGLRRIRDRFERAFADQSSQLNQLQQAVDTVAVEVERISEGQRYVTKVLSEGAPPGVLPGRKVAEPAPSSRNG